ncbi:hypothetical protein [Halocalculus aciditolerans]|uniref:Uncharacterized protein n=1 Tax=Halocalculus aciditolerans TaxID=1383812 RepID=A0A830F8N5_9EURY|nr:hypothetical protein [Halocalculus aciditolerans]GGL50821.1 hypothetical protein GCM10009039_06310 [Halocalculus aciditolerans]
MKPDDIPGFTELVAAGPDDRVFDTLVLVGPIVVLALAVFGRGVATTALAAVYLLGFVGYVCLLGIRRARESDST